MYQITLIRHGESKWNKLNLFTGWVDVDLSPVGVKEAKQAGKLLKQNKFMFDTVFTSILKRAIHTTNYVLKNLEQDYLPVIKSWQLNERHYGGLQGLNKAETAEKFGADQVKIWRRSFDIQPPKLTDQAYQKFYKNPMFRTMNQKDLPATESLKDTIKRVVPYFVENIKPLVLEGKKVLIVAHGNSLRSLVKYFKEISDDDIVELNIPTGKPYVFELDSNMRSIKDYYLGETS